MCVLFLEVKTDIFSKFVETVHLYATVGYMWYATTDNVTNLSRICHRRARAHEVTLTAE